ncbi:MAG: hypothetical protein IPI67_09065 [Myxococcales bacterium]|nr:hypothetical protein [Myxococcales bacterium]
MQTARRRSFPLLLVLLFALLACKGKPETLAKPGDLVTFDDSQWVVVGASVIGKQVQGLTGDKKTSGKFLKVDFKVTNTSKESETILDHPKVFDDQAREFKPLDDQAMFIHEPEQSLTLESLPPSMLKRFTALYELPADAKGLSFEARALSAFGARRRVSLGL